MTKLHREASDIIVQFPMAVALVDANGTIVCHSNEWHQLNPGVDIKLLKNLTVLEDLTWEELTQASKQELRRGWTVKLHVGQNSKLQHLSLSSIQLNQAEYFLAHLDENEQNKAKFFEHADEMLCQIDANGDFIEVNSTLCRFLGKTKSELMHKPFDSFVYENDTALFKGALERLQHKQQDMIFLEHRIISTDHLPRWVELHAVNDTKIDCIHMRLNDIDWQKEQDQKIQGAADLLDATIKLQDLYITGAQPRTLFDKILECLRRVTFSDYGFIGIIDKKRDTVHKLKILAISYKNLIKHYPEIQYEYDDFEYLFTYPIQANEPVISNTPQNDPRNTLNPPKLKHMKNFLGIPLIGKDGVVGIVGLANTKQDYTHTQVQRLDLLIKIVSSIIEAQNNAMVLEHLAVYDHTTGLFNRNHFERALQEAIEQSKKSQKQFALLCLDLDKFKNINDTLGHKIGDQLLHHVGMRLKNAVRETDFIARLGGDEFAIIAYDIQNPRNLEVISDKITHKLRAPFIIQGKELKIEASIGIAIYPDSGEDPVKLLAHADFALYRAKNQVFTRFCFYSKKLQKIHYRRIEIEDHLEEALLKDQFFMVYQPQINLKDGSVRGFEALIRWEHPQLGRISPGEFIPVAEETGKIDALNLWVIKRTLQDYAEISKTCKRHFQVSINISPRINNLRENFQEITHILEDHLNELHYIDIEITETALVDKLGEFEKILQELNEQLHLKITIDDFGIAFSSMNRLRTLPVKAIKIDMSFIQEICKEHKTAMIVKSIIDLGHNLDIDVIAEGVEDKDQLEKLRDLGCRVIQGFYFHPPLEYAELIKVLQNSP